MRVGKIFLGTLCLMLTLVSAIGQAQEAASVCDPVLTQFHYEFGVFEIDYGSDGPDIIQIGNSEPQKPENPGEGGPPYRDPKKPPGGWNDHPEPGVRLPTSDRNEKRGPELPPPAPPKRIEPPVESPDKLPN